MANILKYMNGGKKCKRKTAEEDNKTQSKRLKGKVYYAEKREFSVIRAVAGLNGRSWLVRDAKKMLCVS